MNVNKKNWTNWMIVGIFTVIVLTCTILIVRSKYRIHEEIKAAHAYTKENEPSFEIWTVEGRMQEVLNSVLPSYQKLYPDIKFKVKAYKIDLYHEMLLNAARTNSLPDMFYSWGNERLEELVQLDVVSDLTYAVQLQAEDTIYQEALSSYTFNEHIYGLPVFGWNNVLYCNTEIFKACELDIPSTYDELVSSVKAFKTKGVTPFTISSSEAQMPSLYFMELALAYEDIKIVKGLSENPKYFGMEGFYKAAKDLETLIALEPWQSNFEVASSAEATTEFIKGNSAMLVSGSWECVEIEDMKHSLVKGKIQAVNFPRANSKQVGIAGYTDGFVLNKQAHLKDKDVKLMFVQMMRDLSDVAVVEKGLGIPVYQDQSLENTNHTLLKECLSIFPTESYHEPYNQLLDAKMAAQYDELLLAFVNHEVDARDFIGGILQSESRLVELPNKKKKR